MNKTFNIIETCKYNDLHVSTTISGREVERGFSGREVLNLFGREARSPLNPLGREDPLEGFAPYRFRAKREQLEGFTDVCLKNGSSQGHNLDLTVLFLPTSLDSGTRSQILKEKDFNLKLSGGEVYNTA